MDFYFSSSHIFTSLAARYNTFPTHFHLIKHLFQGYILALENLLEQYIKYRQLKQHSVDLILKGMHPSRKSHRDQRHCCWGIIVYSLHEFTGVCIFINFALTMMFYFPKIRDCALELFNSY